MLFFFIAIIVVSILYLLLVPKETRAKHFNKIGEFFETQRKQSEIQNKLYKEQEEINRQARLKLIEEKIHEEARLRHEREARGEPPEPSLSLDFLSPFNNKNLKRGKKLLKRVIKFTKRKKSSFFK